MTTPGVQERLSGRRLRVLYLFAGQARKADLRWFLEDSVRCCHLELTEPTALHLAEVDVIRGEQRDLGLPELRARCVQEVEEGRWDAVVATPPCSSFSRALFADDEEPHPVRSKQWPLGFPWLRAHDRQKADKATELAFFAFGIIEACQNLRIQHGLICGAFLEHPEDLGIISLGKWPASIWQLPRARALVLREDFNTFSFLQDQWSAPYKKPIRVVADLPGAQERWGILGGQSSVEQAFIKDLFHRGPRSGNLLPCLASVASVRREFSIRQRQGRARQVCAHGWRSSFLRTSSSEAVKPLRMGLKLLG